MPLTIEDLQKASPEELIEAICFHLDHQTYEAVEHLKEGIRLGFAIAQKDGWKQIAPVWLEEYRTITLKIDYGTE